MPREKRAPSWQRVGSLAALLLVVAALYLGKALFLPFALAMLLAFLLGPLVHAFERLRLPRVPAVVVTLLLASAAIAGVAWVVYEQVDRLADRLPGYRENVRLKIATLRGVGPVRKIQERLADLVPAEGEAAPAEAPGAARLAPQPDPRPAAQAVPVTLVPSRPTPVEFVESSLGPLLTPLSTAAVVFVLVLFFLVYQEDLRNRVIRLVSRRELVRTTQAMADASQRISRYLVMTLVVNVTYGIPIGLGLWLLGVPNALLWGILAALLRFIPYVGPWIAALFPIFLSFASSPGWGLTLSVVALFVVVELVSNNLVEPWLYGKRTGLAPVAVVVAAIFWTWLWGTIGLLLAIPLTLVLAVLGRYVPQLHFLNVLLRDEPSLRPDERYYQRLVAGDPEEAATVAEEHARAHGRAQAYDDVLIPALRASRYDALDGRLDADSLAFIRESTQALVEDLSERDVGPDPGAAPEDAPAATPAPEGGGPPAAAVAAAPRARVLLVSAGDETDALTATMLADVLRDADLDVELVPGAAGRETAQAVRDGTSRVVCICGIAPYVVLRARHLAQRVRAARPDVRVLLALWGAEPRPGVDDRLKAVGVDEVVTSVDAAANAVRAVAGDGRARAATPRG